MFGALSKKSSAIEASSQEAQQRYDEIVQLLVAAGYFRARIAALSPFDKVVGGMAWCMTATQVDVDVAFQDRWGGHEGVEDVTPPVPEDAQPPLTNAGDDETHAAPAGAALAAEGMAEVGNTLPLAAVNVEDDVPDEES